ncbi:MAG: hypothetical protein IH948_09805 [Bacteroidetes bacterium]|nr:hypothetical protein [Bacteroidota bacterium]
MKRLTLILLFFPLLSVGQDTDKSAFDIKGYWSATVGNEGFIIIEVTPIFRDKIFHFFV